MDYRRSIDVTNVLLSRSRRSQVHELIHAALACGSNTEALQTKIVRLRETGRGVMEPCRAAALRLDRRAARAGCATRSTRSAITNVVERTGRHARSSATRIIEPHTGGTHTATERSGTRGKRRAWIA